LSGAGWVGEIPLFDQQRDRTVNSGLKTAAESARLFNVHPSTVARLLARNKLTN
jgi:hypothetical protein